MDDDLDLLHGSDGPGGPARRPWVLVVGGMLVALLTLVGIGWMVTSVLANDGTVTAGAAPTTTPAPVPSTTPAAAPEPTASESAFPTALPPSTPTPVSTYSVPVPSAVTVAPTTRRPTPRVTPRPTPRLTPRPTTPPIGLRVVPEVVGQRVRTATAVLQAAGFRVSVLGGGIIRPGRDSRRVTAQRPGPGATAPAGSLVILVTDGL